jgi:hypothetical protein
MSTIDTASAIKTSTSLRDVCEMGWDALVAGGDLYLASPWLRVEERIAPVQPTYLLSQVEGRLAAGLTCYRLGPDTPPWPFARIDAFITRLLKEAGHDATAAEPLLKRTLPTLLCGGRRPGHTRLLLAPHLDDIARRERTTHVLEAVEESGQHRGAASLSFLYIDEDDRITRDVLRERGYIEFPSARASRLTVPASFDQYLEDLPVKRRSAVRTERQKLEAAGITYHTRPLTEDLIQEILPLELALYAKYETEFPPHEAAKLHRTVAEVLGDRVQVLTAEHDGKIRGFVVLIRWQDTLYARQAGFDYEFQGNLPLYFGLIFYATLEYAIAHGARFIEYGIGSEQAKVYRGCHVRQQYGYVNVFNAADHAALRGILEQAGLCAG